MHAIKDIAVGVKHADILPEDINESLISQSLYTYKSLNPDLLIRTSGEVRLSNFLLWQVRRHSLIIFFYSLKHRPTVKMILNLFLDL